MQCTISRSNVVARHSAARAPHRVPARAPLVVFAGIGRKENDPGIEEAFKNQQEHLKERRETPNSVTLASGKTEPGAEKRTASQTPPANPAMGEDEVDVDNRGAQDIGGKGPLGGLFGKK